MQNTEQIADFVNHDSVRKTVAENVLQRLEESTCNLNGGTQTNIGHD